MASSRSNALSMAQYGLPAGVSKNAMAKQSYVQDSSGRYRYVGPKVESRTAGQKVFATTDSNGNMNPASTLRNSQAVAKQQLKNDNAAARSNLLRDANIAQADWNAQEMNKKATIPGYKPVAFTESAAYRDNRLANSNLGATYNTDLAALKEEQQKVVDDLLNAKYANQQKQREARSLIFSGGAPEAQQDIIAARKRQAIANGLDPNSVDTSMPTLNAEYLKSIGLLSGALDESGKPIMYGVGSTNFDPTSGQFGITMAQRNQLAKDRTDLANGKYDDLIAQGRFSPSNTGIIGYDGKPLPQENMTYGGNIYQGDSLGGFNFVSPIKAPALQTSATASNSGANYQDLMNQFTSAIQSLQTPQANPQATSSDSNNQSYSVGPSTIGVSGLPTLASSSNRGGKATTKTVGGSAKYTVPQNTSVRFV